MLFYYWWLVVASRREKNAAAFLLVFKTPKKWRDTELIMTHKVIFNLGQKIKMQQYEETSETHVTVHLPYSPTILK